MDLYFSDHFKVKETILEQYGAFNISLVTDLPLFIDPFLLFNSRNKRYRQLHDDIIKYLIFLKDKSTSQTLESGPLKAWYVFKEVKQNWFGYSVAGNKGSALGPGFGRALNANLHRLFYEFGQERVSRGSHLEKLCLLKDGVGKDNISDFATNLIKEFLLSYTQTFAQRYLDESLRRIFRVRRVRFNYETQSWEDGEFELPHFKGDFVILTPKNLLTKDETWINKTDLYEGFDRIPPAISDDELRFKVNNYFLSQIPKHPGKAKEPTKKERVAAAAATIQAFPQLIDYYIKGKEESGALAESISSDKVGVSRNVYINNVRQFVVGLQNTEFYAPAQNSYEEAKRKITILKHHIENNDGYKLFYHRGERIKGEDDLQLLFSLVCCQSSISDVNREVNNGRGPVDFKLSKASADKTLVEFKLASNNKLERNLQKQVEIYERANQATHSFKVIVYFTESEHKRVIGILKRIGLDGKENIVLIDARKDNKISASNA